MRYEGEIRQDKVLTKKKKKNMRYDDIDSITSATKRKTYVKGKCLRLHQRKVRRSKLHSEHTQPLYYRDDEEAPSS